MVLLIEKVSEFYSKLENHYHHHHLQELEAVSVAFQTFQSVVRNGLTQLSHLEILSWPWIQGCFRVLPVINKAFAKLVVDIDHPVSNWEAKSVEEYLQYSLEMLELLNSISSSLSHLGQTRLSLSHAVSLVENSPSLGAEKLRAVELKSERNGSSSGKDLKEQAKEKEAEDTFVTGKERVIHQALQELKGTGLWVCWIVLAALSGDVDQYLEMRKSGFSNSSLIGLDSSVFQAVKDGRWVLKEEKELNDEAAGLAASIDYGESSDDAAGELQRKLEVFEKQLDGLGTEVDCLFSEILARRNELIHGFRFRKH